MKSHPGDVAISDFDWSTGEAPRRSARISEKVKAAPPQEEPPRKRARKSPGSKKKEQNEAEKSDGVKETEIKDAEMSEKEHPEIEKEKESSKDEEPKKEDETKEKENENSKDEEPKIDDETKEKENETSKDEEPKIEDETKEKELETSKDEEPKNEDKIKDKEIETAEDEEPKKEDVETKDDTGIENVPGDTTETKNGQLDAEDGKEVEDQSQGNVQNQEVATTGENVALEVGQDKGENRPQTVAKNAIDSCCMKQEKAGVGNIKENGVAEQENCSGTERTPASEGTITENEDARKHEGKHDIQAEDRGNKNESEVTEIGK